MIPAVAFAFALVLAAMGLLSAFIGVDALTLPLHFGATLVECIFHALVVIVYAATMFTVTVVVMFALPGGYRSRWATPVWFLIACLALLVDGSLDAFHSKDKVAARVSAIKRRHELDYEPEFQFGIRPFLHLASLLFDNISERLQTKEMLVKPRAARQALRAEIRGLRKSIFSIHREIRELAVKCPNLPALDCLSWALPDTLDFVLSDLKEIEPSVFRRFYHRDDLHLEWLRATLHKLDEIIAHDKLALEQLKDIESESRRQLWKLEAMLKVSRPKRATPPVNREEEDRRKEFGQKVLRFLRIRKLQQRVAARAAEDSAAQDQPRVLEPMTEPEPFSTSGQIGVTPTSSSAAEPAECLPQLASCLVFLPEVATQGMVEWSSATEVDEDVEMADVNDEEMPTEQMALVHMIPPVSVPVEGATVQFLSMEMDLDESPEIPEASNALTTTTADNDSSEPMDLDTSILVAASDDDPLGIASFKAAMLAEAEAPVLVAASQPTSDTAIVEAEEPVPVAASQSDSDTAVAEQVQPATPSRPLPPPLIERAPPRAPSRPGPASAPRMRAVDGCFLAPRKRQARAP